MKNQIIRKTILLWTLALSCLLATAQKQIKTHFDHYTVKDGLSSDYVHGLEMDSYGHIWASTQCGLNRFDGTTFRQFKIEEYPSLLRNDGQRMLALEDGNLLIGGYLGMLVKYNNKTDHFDDLTPMDFDTTYYKEIVGFHRTKNNEIFVCTSSGIYRYDKQSGEFSNDFPAFRSISKHFVRSIHMDELGRYWVSSFNILYVYSKEGELLKKIDLSTGYKQMFISNIYPMNDTTLLVSSFSDIIYYFHIQDNGEITQSAPLKTPFYNLSDVLRDKQGRYWFTSDGNGLWVTDKIPYKADDFTKVMPFDTDESAFDKIYTITEDFEGNIWVGTKNSGIWKCRKKIDDGVITSSNVRYPFSTCCNFNETKDGKLLIASDGGGLTLTTPDFSNMKHFETINKNVINISGDKNGNFWITTWGGGLYIYNHEKGTISPCSFDGLRTNLNCFFSTTIMKNGEVWACTAGDGIYIRENDGIWKRKIPSFPKLENDQWIYKVVEGRSDSRWILSSRTIWRYRCGEIKPLLTDFTKEKDHNPLAVNDAVCDDEGNLYVASNKGVLYFSPDGTRCDTLDYVPMGDYCSICIGKDKNIYVNGMPGIMSINTKSKTCKPYAVDYTGKGANYFSYRASYCDSNGRLFFGCNDGFLSFDPAKENHNDTIRHFGFSNLSISDIKALPGGEFLPEGNIATTKEIRLNHDETNIEIDIDLIDYSGFKAICDYRLLGLNDKWTRVKENRKISFSYIPAGDYTLEVRAYKPSQIENAKTISLKITILPPWWKTWWFNVLLALTICGLFAFVISHRIKRITKQNEILEAKVKERTKELNEANQEISQQNKSLKENQLLIEMKNEELRDALTSKDHLITIIAHDLKNPMFGIASAMEHLDRNPEQTTENEKKKIIADVAETAKSLQTELANLLQWASSQDEIMNCQPTDTDLRFIVKDNQSFFKNLLDEKDITLTVANEAKSEAFVDPRMIGIVIRNLIANAIKFTPEGGEIAVRSWDNEKSIFVSVSDNGIGMNDEQKSNIFNGETTLGTNNEVGSGLGLKTCKQLMELNGGGISVESEVDKGTTITLEMPISEKTMNPMAESERASETLPNDFNQAILKEANVLIVEDDSLIRLHLRKVLEKYMAVTEAENGKEALEKISDNRPDVILSDVEMPVMDGIAFAKAVRTQNDLISIPFLFLSARNSESDRMEGLTSGAIDYMTKPVDDNELLMKLRNILLTRQAKTQQILSQQMELISEEGALLEESDKEITSPMLQRVMQSIESRYKDSNFSIDDICGDLEMSQSTLNRKLKTLTGKTSNTLINEYRLHKAKYLLEHSDMNISEIAYEVGFNDPHYFSKKFKSHFGTSPSKSGN